jgi:hypothetical protein
VGARSLCHWLLRNQHQVEILLGNKPSLPNFPKEGESPEMLSQHQRSQIFKPLQTRRLLQPYHLIISNQSHCFGIRQPRSLELQYYHGALSYYSITIITVYCPKIQSIETAGPLTNYFQQYHQLRQNGITAPDPRKTFFTDLTTTVHELVIMLDSNDDLNDSSPTHPPTHSRAAVVVQ